MRILVLHPGALGDLILALPALDVLRESFPNAELTVAGNLDFLDLIARGHSDRTLSLATLPLHLLYRDEPPADPELRFWRGFDTIVAWTGAGDERFVRNLRAASPESRVAAWRPGPGDERHVSQIFVDSLGLAGAREAPLPWIRLGAAGGIHDPAEAPVVLHPGAGSAAKRWPEERFAELARLLAGRGGARAVAIEGPAEPGAAVRLAAAVPGVNALRSAPLGDLARILQGARAFVGNDSGVTHLAAALGTPTVALFGPTDPVHWAPRGPRVRVVRAPGGALLGISVEECAAALAALNP